MDDAREVSGVLKALSNPVRLRLLSLVLNAEGAEGAEGAEACLCDLLGEFKLPKPNISHHLTVLHEAGLLDREKRGV